MAPRLGNPAWLHSPETRKVLAALTAEGAEVRFIGGCVRDTLIGRDVTDIDIATPDKPDAVIRLLEAAGIKAVPTGIKHGTITAVTGNRHFEITTLRVDVRSHGRHADVAFTDDWQADAARRDFTMNALAATPDGAVIDYFEGLRDLKAGHVRFVGDALQRIEEDHLRALRFFRFHAWYGTGAPDAAGLEASAAQAHTIPKLSGERIRNEMLRLLAAPDPAPVLAHMNDAGVLEFVMPEARDPALFEALVKIDAAEADPLRRLAALLRPSDGAALAERWRLSSRQALRLKRMAEPAVEVSAALDQAAQRQALYAVGADLFRDLVWLAWAGGGDAKRFKAMLRHTDTWRRPRFPARGADVLALGMKDGPDVGRLLKAVEAWWIEQDFQPQRKAVLEELRRRAALSRPSV